MSQVEARFDLDRSRFLQKREQNIRAGQFPVVGSLALKPLEQVPQSINPVIWNQAFYFDLYHQVHNRATTLGFGEDEARDLAEQQTHKAMWFDAVAVLQEKVPNETVLGKPIFDPISQAKLTLTPTENVYFVETDPETDQPILVCPEHRWLRKSITKTLTNWRRKLDINVVNLVEQLVAQDSQEERNDSRTLLWDSLIAEDWEEKVIRDNNGEYGYTYVLRLINHPDTGARLAVVHAIKSDVKATSYKYFLENTQGKFYKATETTYKNKEFEGPFVSSIETLEGGGDKRPLLDRLMSTVVELSLGTSDDEVLRQLAKAKKVKEDTDEI
ncbi:hypothetical protein HYS97_00585, partial [Candidatus Daviesbacteria bacterium]|nr:hypothetical protein [Candidatus Daviesbacteria bacterium]